MICHQCQASVPNAAKFCNNCGAKQIPADENLPEADTTTEEQLDISEEKDAPGELVDTSEEIKSSEAEAHVDTSSDETRENTTATSANAVAVVAESTEQKKEYASEDIVTPDQLRVTPGIAALLSVLFVGLGQMLNGQLYKGLLMLVIQLALSTVTCGITVIPGWIVSGIDAYGCAKALQEGKTLGKWSFFGQSVD